jgi:AcrR family transcriptional regulator
MSRIDERTGWQVPHEIVAAALRAASAQGAAVADVTLRDIAQEAGISRSTLLRRLGGSRQGLDEALRAAGIEPGGRKPVRERAIEAAGALIGEHGLGTVTFERVAAAAECSVPSLYATFGGRDELLQAVFERYSPILDVEAFMAGPHGDLEDTVRHLYRMLADALECEPRILPALLAEVFARPGDENIQVIFRNLLPRLLAGLGRWLAGEVAAGRIRDLPLLLLTQQMTSPIIMHFLLRPATDRTPGADLPGRDEAIETFTRTFINAVALSSPGGHRERT